MSEFSLFLLYEMVVGISLGYLNDTVHKVPTSVRRANFCGRLINKAVIQLGWKLICATLI